jgi:ketosteroid isomerase-like protein
MSIETANSTSAAADISLVQNGFAVLESGDLAGFGDLFHDDATWNHRNDDRFGGIHSGSDAITAFVGESMQLTAGTLRVPTESFLADGDGRVCVLVRVSGTRPDGRTFDDPQVLVFRLDGDRVRSVDQHVGDPSAVAAFWA